MIDPLLNNKVVLITGANHGIGAATARVFSALKSKVFITYYRDKDLQKPEAVQSTIAEGVGGPEFYLSQQQRGVNGLLDEIRNQGGSAYAHEADLSNTANISFLFDLCEEHLGPVDVLVNNHTYCKPETFDPARVTDQGFPINLLSEAVIDAHFAINTRAYALMMREYIRRYLNREAKWGRIINLSTDAAHAHESNVSYAASKHAIESYTRSAALEVGKYGITINVVAPGPTQTGYITPEAEVELCAGTPLGRLGEPDDIADVIVFLASEQGRWITGQLLYAGGGWRIGQ